ncbi:MAG: hypothetical protein HY878_07090 [Deltaproteobacteria bacterium]|nr:hypothetical protein [Deltaproteobacteria bacterium]
MKGMIKDRKALRGEINRRVIYGSEDFVREVGKRYKVGATINPIGRPKKEEDDRK